IRDIGFILASGFGSLDKHYCYIHTEYTWMYTSKIAILPNILLATKAIRKLTNPRGNRKKGGGSRVNRGDCDCSTDDSFTSHTPTNRFLPAACARSPAGISMYAAAKPMNLFFISAAKLSSGLKSRIVARKISFGPAVWLNWFCGNLAFSSRSRHADHPG